MSGRTRVTWHRLLSASASAAVLTICCAHVAYGEPRYYNYLPSGMDDIPPPLQASATDNFSRSVTLPESRYQARRAGRAAEDESDEDSNRPARAVGENAPHLKKLSIASSAASQLPHRAVGFVVATPSPVLQAQEASALPNAAKANLQAAAKPAAQTVASAAPVMPAEKAQAAEAAPVVPAHPKAEAQASNPAEKAIAKNVPVPVTPAPKPQQVAKASPDELPWLRNPSSATAQSMIAAQALQTSVERVNSSATYTAARIDPPGSQLAMLSPAAGAPAPVQSAPLTDTPDIPVAAPPPESVRRLAPGNTTTSQSMPPLPEVPDVLAAAVPAETARRTEPLPEIAAASQPMPPLPEPPPMPSHEPMSAQNETEPGKKLSGQSKQILDALPPEKPHAKVRPAKVSIDHAHANPLEATEVKEHNGVGITMSVKRPKADVNGMLESAYDALIAGNQEDAVRIYKEVLSDQPDNKLALFGLATTYHRAGQLQLARPLYGKLLAIDPHNVEGLNNFLVLLSDESPQEALTELDKLRRTHPGFSPVPAQMAIIYEKLGNYDSAIKEMSHAIDLSPENLKYRYDMAIMLDKQGAWQEAAVIYQQLMTASDRGEKIPANPEEIQERLTFIRSNRVKG